MSRILAVVSPKGGVGKTTLALNLGCSLAMRGWRTLVVDTDPQGGIASSVEGVGKKGAGLVAYLENRATLAEAIVLTKVPTLALLPVHGAGTAPEHMPRAATLLSEGEELSRALREAAIDYDVVVVDTPSGLHGPTARVLEDADFLLVPLQAEPLALRAVPLMLGKLAELKARGAAIELAGFVITMLNSKSDISLSVAQESWSTIPPELVLHGFVPRDILFLNASAHGVPLHFLSRRPPAVAAVFHQLAAELEPRLRLPVDEQDDAPISLVD